jgi:hypothetical protein
MKDSYEQLDVEEFRKPKLKKADVTKIISKAKAKLTGGSKQLSDLLIGKFSTSESVNNLIVF